MHPEPFPAARPDLDLGLDGLGLPDPQRPELLGDVVHPFRVEELRKRESDHLLVGREQVAQPLVGLADPPVGVDLGHAERRVVEDAVDEL